MYSTFFSGPDYFKRFCLNPDGSTIDFMTSAEVNKFLTSDIDVDKFIAELKNYVLDVNDKLFCDKKMVFIIESQTFRTNTEEPRKVSVLVSIY